MQKLFVVILMPFDSSSDDIYNHVIKAVCEEAGAYCERVDQEMFGEGTLDRIYNQISKADLVIADLSGRNPNVFYEIGYAQALCKQVILLSKTTKDIPFDLKHYNVLYALACK